MCRGHTDPVKEYIAVIQGHMLSSGRREVQCGLRMRLVRGEESCTNEETFELGSCRMSRSLSGAEENM